MKSSLQNFYFMDSAFVSHWIHFHLLQITEMYLEALLFYPSLRSLYLLQCVLRVMKQRSRFSFEYTYLIDPINRFPKTIYWKNELYAPELPWGLSCVSGEHVNSVLVLLVYLFIFESIPPCLYFCSFIIICDT